MAQSALQQRSDAQSSSLEVHLLGQVDYDAMLGLQERLVFEISGRGDRQGILLLCEHPPVITIGREGSRAHVLAESHDLEALEIDVRWIGRGGGAMIHAPGQLGVYPLLPLNRLSCGLLEFRQQLEEALLAACRDVELTARRMAGVPGLWCRGGQVASFGAAVKNWTSYHGAFLNVSIAPGFLRMVESFPIGERMTSLESELRRPVAMHKVREAVVRHIAGGFGYERTHVYTDHPLLVRTRRRVCQHA